MESQITRSAAWELLRKYKGGTPMMITSGRVPGLVLPPGGSQPPDYSKPVVLKRICSATIYTMNCPNEEVYRQMNYHVLMDTAANQLGVFGPTEILCSYDTYQFSNYDRYDAATFSEAHKAEVRDNQFPIDLEKAYELGKRLVGKCDKNREV